MSATGKEREGAQTNGVRIKHWAQPRRLLGWPANGGGAQVKEVEFEYTQLDERGRLVGTGDTFTLLVDQVFKAVGQYFVPSALRDGLVREPLATTGDRIAVNDDSETSLPGVFEIGRAS